MKYAVVFACLGLVAAIPSARAEFDPPVPVRTVAPVFPTEMRREGIDGIVLVDCVIDAHGNVQNPTVKKASNDAFSEPALEALKQWKFKPAEKDGTKVPVRVAIPVRFTLDD
ncbi:MAG: energy transducer TonB [Opitutaceae bacterium]